MIVAVIQSRMGSSRLPGKVLMDIHGKTLLERQIERISPSRLLDKIIIATSTNSEDDALETFCKERNFQYFRGSDWDVLDRFYQAIKTIVPEAKTIVRICSDNPLLSHQVVDEVVANYLQSGKSYFSNSNQEPDYLEDGFDVEVFSSEALEDAWKNAALLSEREHVCPYIKKHFSCAWKKTHADYHYKLSVDTEDDLNLVRSIFEKLGPETDFSIHAVVDLLQAHPELIDLNKDSSINSGYQKSLKNDRKVK